MTAMGGALLGRKQTRLPRFLQIAHRHIGTLQMVQGSGLWIVTTIWVP